MTTIPNPELHIVEYIDDDGRYCLVYTDDTPEGDEAVYDSLEQAANKQETGQ